MEKAPADPGTHHRTALLESKLTFHMYFLIFSFLCVFVFLSREVKYRYSKQIPPKHFHQQMSTKSVFANFDDNDVCEGGIHWPHSVRPLFPS